MFAKVYRSIRQMWGKLPAFVALTALVASGLVATEAPLAANAAIVTNNLVMNLDGTDASSLPASGNWSSISPASGAFSGAISGATRAGGTYGGLNFDANIDYVNFGSNTGYIPGSMTFEAWIKPGNMTANKWSIIASRWFDSPTVETVANHDWHFGIFHNGTSATLQLDASTQSSSLRGNTVFPLNGTNKWYQVGFKFDATAGTAQLFVNGVADSAANTASHSASTVPQFWLGDGRTTGTTNPLAFNGQISKVRMYNSALTSAQLAQNFLADSDFYGIAPVNTVAPAISGLAKVGKTLNTDGGTWGAGDSTGTTTSYQWQTSPNKSSWVNISGATSSTYTIVSGDVSNYIRLAVTKSNAAGTVTAYSNATNAIQAANTLNVVSGGKLTGLTSTVPNDANIYNVTLASSNLSSTLLLGTTTGLTWVEGRSVPVGYMATSLSNAAPIVTFRGTGTAINTALANVTYTSTAGNNDVVKLYYASGASTATDTKNYIPIYDNGQLTFHYYAYKFHSVAKNRADMEAALVGLTTTDNVSTPGPWYLATPRYQVEWTRISAITGQNQAFMGAYADAGSSNWYWPANTDGFTSATIYATSAGTGSITATSTIYNNTNTTLPYASGEPNGGTTGARSGFFYVPAGGSLGWDDVPITVTNTNFTMETFGTAPFSTVDGTAGSLAQTFHVASISNAPTGLTSTILGDTATLSWTAPTTPGTDAISDYQIDYSSDGTTWTNWVHTASTATSAKITGLTPGVAYYVRVAAITSDVGAYTASTLSTVTATTINIVTSGGGIAGTDYVLNGTYLSAKSGATINVNAGDIQTLLLTGAVVIAADTVNVNAPITWATSQFLTLGNKTTSTVAINQSITASGATAGFRIASSTYSLDVKNAVAITLTGGTPTLSIGGNAYTLIKSTSDLGTVTTTGFYALAKPIAYATGSTALAAAPINLDFTGTLDGLGNTVDRLNLSLTTSVYAGLIKRIGTGSVVRNIGVTNASVKMSTLANNYVVGLIAGASTQSGASTIDQTWSSGMIYTVGSTISGIAAGGILGMAESGSVTISKSWSSASIDTRTSGTSTYLMQGGIIGGDTANLNQNASSPGGLVTLNQVYATGTLQWVSVGWRGIGGLFGLHYQSSGSISITDSFSWVNFANSPTGNLGGIIGVANGSASTITRSYQATYANTCWDAGSVSITATPSCSTAQTIGATSATTGMSGAAWSTTGPSSLVNLPAPTKPIYVQVVAPTDGTYSSMGYKLVDANGSTISSSSWGLVINGTPNYSIARSAANGTYSVDYTSGLTLSGTNGAYYSLQPWSTATSVTISGATSGLTTAPTGLTVTNAGSGTVTLGWTAATTTESTAISGYTVRYSTSEYMTSPTSVSVGNTTGAQITGLTNGTLYYFQVRAVGSSTWSGTYSSTATGTPTATATSITVVSSGGGVAGTNYTVNGGVISSTGSASINASDIITLLGTQGTATLAADTVTVNAPLTWSSNAVLTLGNSSSSTVSVNSTITGSGDTAGVKILPTTYSLSVKNSSYIRLTGATPSFNLGGTAYTVVNTAAQVPNITAAMNVAITAPITLSSTYNTSVRSLTFTGTLDGLGNTVNGMTIATATGNTNYGFFDTLSGATVRNIGFTNVNISSSVANLGQRLGSLAGNGCSSGTCTVSQVWATGFINQSATTGQVEAGGIFGGATGGTLNISKTWSSVAVSTNAPYVGSGGIIGTNSVSLTAGNGTGNTLSISESYSTGNILRFLPSSAATASWYGNGGIIGVSYGAGATITNSFSWGNINSTGVSAGTSTAGIVGVPHNAGTSVSNSYTTNAACGGNTVTNCVVNATAGVALTSGTGFTSGVWQSVNGTSLTNLALPTKSLYVQVIAPTDGSYATMNYQIVDSTGTVQTLSSLGLTISGTPTYTIASNVARGTYSSVSYVSGLTLAGSSSSVYSLNPWITPTSVTITRLPQTFTWTPTTAITFGNGTFTPSAVPSSEAVSIISYSVANAGTSNCTVAAGTGVVTYTSAGTCSITATGASTTDFTSASATVTFTISAAPTITIVPSGGGISGTDYTVSGGLLQSTSNVSVNASDLATLLAAGNLTLAGNVIVNSDITWSSNSVLTLGGLSSNTVVVNSLISASGNTAGLVIKPAAYTLDVKSGDAIRLTGTTPTLSIGGNSYTLIKAISGLSSVTTTGYYALAKPLTFTSSTTAAPMAIAFAGNFDGLGNTLDGMVIKTTANGSYGLFQTLGGATVRNLGITNGWISTAVTSSGQVNGGLLAGETTGTNLVEQVWTTGLLSSTSGSYTRLGFGGLIADATAGSLTINKSWSSASVLTTGSTVTSQAVGGILATNCSVVGGNSTVAGATIVMNEVYATGDLAYATSSNWRGIGGVMGIAYATNTTTLNDVFSWSTLSGNDGNYAGIIGVAQTGTVTVNRAYTTYSTSIWSTYSAGMTATSVNTSIAMGTSSVAGLTTSVWSTTGTKQLVNLPTPKRPLYIQVVAPTDGSYGTITNKLIDGASTAVTTGATIATSGTATHNLDASSPLATYNALYVSGLSLTGTNAGYYSLSPWPVPTSVTISKWAQTITLSSTAPTTATVGSTYTLTGTASSSLAIAYTIDSTTTSICSISNGVVTFNALGTCKVNANQAGNSSYLAAPQVQQSAIVTVKGDSTITFTSTALLPKVSGLTYTPTATASSGLPVTFTIAAAAADYCSISGGVVSFTKVGDCVINADSASTANWNAATQVAQTLTVGKGASTVTFTSTAPSNAVVGGTGYTVTSTKTIGNTNSVVYAIDSSATSVCSIASGVVTFQGVGTCKVNANLDGDSQYEAASQVQQSFTVGKGSQILAFTSLAPNAAKVGGSSYTVTATGGASTSLIQLSVDSSSTSKCSVSGMVVTYLAVGNCVLNLNQAGDANYNAATQVQQTVTITTDGRCPNGVVSGNYCLIRFNSSGTWTVPAGVTAVDILAVGGGGAGGGGAGGHIAAGGGGGGEVKELLTQTVTPGTTLSITVGAGGTGGGSAMAATASNPGNPSSITGTGFTTITALGGGQGGSANASTTTALPAGTGPGVAGGGGGSAQVNIYATPGVGAVSSGGAAKNNTTDGNLQAGGGGGGAGGNGGAATATLPGAGGAGKSSVILGTMLGGGGGGAKRSATGGSGSTATAGGGAGGWGAAGTAGTANTGGGGGGSGGANNGANGGSGVVVFRVALQSQTVAFTSTAPTGLTFGTTTTYTPTVSGTASEVNPEITVDAASSAVCSISSGVVSIIGAGTCTLNANQAANGFYSDATQVQQSFTVSKQAQTISFTSTAPTNAVVGGASYTVSATGGGSGSSIVFSTSSSGCSVSGSTVTFTAVGDCVIKANQAGATNYLLAAEVSQTISVAKGVQTISFTSTAPGNAVVGGATYSVTAAGGASGNSVTLSIDSGSSPVCTLSGNTVSFIGVGNCTVLANQASSSNYEAATQVAQTFAVAKGAQAINFTSTAPSSAVVGGFTYTPTATGGATGNSVVFSVDSSATSFCEIANGTVTFIGVGTCSLKANQAGNSNYNDGVEATQSFSVAKGNQIILFTTTTPTNAVVNGSTYTPAAIGGVSGNSVVFSIAASSSAICAISSGQVSFNAVGDCVIEANQDGSSNYLAANTVRQTISVGKGTQAVAFTSVQPASAKVDGTGYTPSVSQLGTEGTVTISIASSSAAVCNLSGGVVNFTAVGVCEVLANQAGTDNFNSAPQVSQTFNVGKGLQVITQTSTNPTNAVVDGDTYTPTFTGGATGNAVVVTIAGNSTTICSVVNGTISFRAAGDCDYIANQAGKDNYESASAVTGTISVAKGTQTLSFTTSAPTSAAVGGATYSPQATGGASGNSVSFRIDIDTASVCAMSNGVVRFVGVGTCTVIASQNGNANYLPATAITQSFSVTKGEQVISFTSAAPTTAVVAGASYTPIATGGATGNTVTFSIAQSSSNVCALNFGKVTFQNVGTCAIEANQLGNTNYNAATQTVQSFTVGKGAQTVAFTSAAPAAKVSGATYTPVVSGGASGNAVTITVAPSSSAICSVTNGVVSYQAVGSCVIEANQASSANYEAASQVTQTITVAKGVQVLNFTSTPPSLRPVQGTTYVPTTSFGNSGNPVVYSIGSEAASICSISNGTISFLAVGDCVLHADQAGNANYTAATRVTQIFDITKGEQVVNFTSSAPTTAVVDGSTYTPAGVGGAGTMPVSFRATAESAGICSVFTGDVYFTGAGDCVIEISQAGDTNYNAATPKFQTISVGKGSQTITFTSNTTTATVDGAAYTPTFTAGQGINPVRLSVSNASSTICEVNSGSIAFHAVGDCVIEANQAGDNNYEPAAMVSQTISVAKGNQTTLVGRSSLNTLTLGSNTPTAVLSTTGGSGLGSVTWSVTPETAAYCSVSGDVVSGLASGYCDLVVTKAADTNYLETTATLSLVVSTGGQTPVRTSVSVVNPTFSEGLTLDLSLTGGDGDGAIWYESLTTHVCNTNGGSTLNVFHAGTCTVIGHKDGDDNYSAVQDILSFSIAKATQSGVTIALAHELTYSPSGAVSAALEVNGALSTGAQSFTVTSGTCTVSNGELTATEAGDCEVSVSILGDDKYLDGSFTQTVRIGKAAQTAVSASLIPDALPAIAWNGRNTTTFEIAGGSGDLVYSASTSTPSICSVALTGSQLVVTGIAQGACDISVGNASSANYLAASTVFSVDVLDLAAAPTSVTAANAVRRQDNTLASTVSWNIPTADSTRAAITGFKVQSKTPNGDWTDVTQDAIAADATSLNVTVAPWTKYNFRVAATTNLDGDTLNWAYFDLSGDNTPDLLAVGGGAVVLSTTKAATTSGETVFVTGSGFQDAGITSVELTTQSPVFAAAGLRPAALLTRKVVPATVISDTKLSFVLPKITLPKGVLTLQASIKVVNSEQLVSDPIPLDYIPKKLAQVLTAALPAPSTVINVGTNLISAGTVTSSVTSNPPVVTATPASVCTASINLFNKLEVTPVSPGKCSISIVVPGTPAYLPSATKTAVYTVKSARTPNLSATINDVTETGELGTARTFTKLNATSLIPGVVNVVVGDGPIDIPVTLSAREGTLLFTVAPADDAAGLCTADPGDSTTGLVGSITVSGVGDCHVTISQPADAGWYLGETIVITVHSVERPSTVVVPDNGEASAVTESELAELLDPADPDDPDTPPVAIDLDPTRTTDYAFGGEDGLGYDPLTGKLNVRSRTPLVGTWTATLTGKWTNPIGSDGKPKMWFKIPGKIVKKVQQYTYANVCKLTLTVKKDKKIKKKVTRLVGAGCILSDAGKAALTAVGIQKIKVKYKRIRQYANTGLSYRGTAKAKTRILKNINRTWLVRVGRRS